MPCCAIRTCRIRRNSIEAKRGSISFHKFPREPDKKLEWVKRINRPGWKPNDSAVLCSRHFTLMDFLDTSRGHKLIKGAVPTLYLNEHLDEKTMALKARERKPRTPRLKKKLVTTVQQETVNPVGDEPVLEIKIEAIGDPPSDPELLQQERIVIADIVKNIMFSLDLLIKSDPDAIRSSTVRDKILSALFCYNDIIDEKDVSLSLTKEAPSNNKEEVDIAALLYQNDNKHFTASEDNCHFVDLNNDFDDKCSDSSEDEFSLSKIKNDLQSKSDREMEKQDRELSKKVRRIIKATHNKGNKKKLVRVTKKKKGPGKRISNGGEKSALAEVNPPEQSYSEVDEEGIHSSCTLKKDCADDQFVSNVPRFVCDICEVTVISDHHLTVHKQLCRRRHYYYGNPLLEEYWNKVKCPLCNVKCTHRGNLGRHYVTHRVKDIELALEPIKERELDPGEPEKNMRVLNDFIKSFETNERLEKEQAAIERCYDIGQTKSQGDADKPEETVNKSTIDEYIQFNLKKVVFDIDINKDLYCFPCDMTFTSKDELEEHRKKINDTDAFVCNHCDKTFDTPTRLINHAKTHTGVCNPTSPYLNFSSETNEGSPRQIDYKIYACKYCLVLFVQELSLHSHLGYYKKHSECYRKISVNKSPKGSRMKRTPPGIQRTEDDKLQCNKCEKSYGNYYLFLEHLASHSEVSKYRCECGKGFKSKQRLRFHIKLVHAKKFQVICEVCGLKVLYFNLRRHMKVHSSLKPFKCDYCSKTFKYKESVISHTRTHTHEKPWRCQYCGMGFSEKRRYNIHVNIHEGKTPYKCNLCPSAFVSKLKLNKHSLEHQDCRI